MTQYGNQERMGGDRVNPKEDATSARLAELIEQMTDEQRERLMAFAEGIAFAMEKKAC